MKKKFLAFLLAVLMVVSLLPMTALAKGGSSVDYVDAAGTPQQSGTSTHVLDSDTEWSGWMYAASDTTINNLVELKADTNLILKDGVTLTVNGGITGEYDLTVYGQTGQTGVLIVNGTNGVADFDGSDGTAAVSANVTVNGGNVTVTGGNGGGGYGEGGGDGGKAIIGTVTVNSGIVTVTGGSGGSGNADPSGSGGVAIDGALTINGGTITVTGGNGGNTSEGPTMGYDGDGGIGVSGNVSLCGGETTIIGGTGGNASMMSPGDNGKTIGGTLTLADTVSAEYGDNSSSATPLSAPVDSGDYDAIKAALYAKFVGAPAPAGPAKYDEVGEGTESAPWEINTLAQLNDLAAAVNGTGDYTDNADDMSGKFFKLTADIGTTAKPFTTPIGAGLYTLFSGTFDGDGHTVTLGMSGELEFAGLFGYADGVIKDVTTAGSVSTTCYDYDIFVAGVCGWLYGDGVILNCHNSADISAAAATESKWTVYYVGGICGENNGRISNCYNGGDLSSSISCSEDKAAVGGVCAANYAGVIENCYSSGEITTVSGDGETVIGGVCGATYNCTITACYYDNEVYKETDATEGVTGLVTDQMQTAAGTKYEEEDALLEGYALVDVLNEFIKVGPYGTNTKGWRRWTVASDEYPQFKQPSIAEKMGVIPELEPYFGYWLDETNRVALNLTDVHSDGNSLYGEIRKLNCELSVDPPIRVYAEYESPDGVLIYDYDTELPRYAGLMPDGTLGIQLFDGFYWLTKQEFSEPLAANPTVELQDFNIKKEDDDSWTLTLDEEDTLREGEAWAYMAIPHRWDNFDVVNSVFVEMKHTLGISTELYGNDWGIEEYLSQMAGMSGINTGIITANTATIPSMESDGGLAAFFVAKVTKDLIDTCGRKNIPTTVGGAVLPEGAAAAENEMDLHDLIVTKSGGGAVKGTADSHEDADYYWDDTENELNIIKDGLTVSGTTTKENIDVLADTVTFKNLSVAVADEFPLNIGSGYNLEIIVKGTNLIQSVVGTYSLSTVIWHDNLTISGNGDLTLKAGSDEESATCFSADLDTGSLTISATGNITIDSSWLGISCKNLTVAPTAGKILVYGAHPAAGAIVTTAGISLGGGVAVKASADYHADEDSITEAGVLAEIEDEKTYHFIKTASGSTAKSVLIQAAPISAHNFTYAATGKVLKATCGDDGCEYKTTPLTLTLTAPASADLVYSATAKEIGFADGEEDAWKTATGSDAPAVVYYLEGGTEKTTTANSGAEGEGKAPVNAGKYVAKVTVDTDKTAVLEFTVAKKQLSKLHDSISWFAERGYQGNNSVAMLKFDVPNGKSLLADDCGFIYTDSTELATFHSAVMNTFEKASGCPIAATATMTTNALVNYEFTVSVELPTEYAGNYEVPDFKITAKVKGIYAKPANGEGYTLDEGTFAITVTDGYEVSATSGDFTTPITSGTPLTEGNTYYIRRAGDGDYYASPETEFKAEVNKRPSSGGSSTPTTTVPVTGDGNSVKVSATVSGSTATVKEIKDADLEKVAGGEIVEIDLSGLNKNIDTAKLPTETVEKIGKQAGMSVRLSKAVVTFDKPATQEIALQAKGDTVELVVDDIKEVSLNAVQKESVKKLDTALIIDAYLVSNGTRLCSESKGGFGGGKATVVLPYEIKNNRTPANYSVFYVDDNGKLQKLNAVYDKELAAFVFEIEHFSVYAVAYDENGMPFTDVAAGEYFYDAVKWAVASGITDGTDATHFSPGAPVTRAQVVTFLWRTAGCPEPKGDASKFVDVKVGSYYEKAVAWAIEQVITKGTSEKTFSPDVVCTRGQIVTFLARFAGVEDADTESVFTDVPANEFFAAAVKWAKDNGVTSGVTDTTFEPYTNCNRAQVVTFLYRWMVK